MKPDVEHMSDGSPAYELPKPSWIKARIPSGPNYQELKGLMRGLGLHTVCEEAHCPNIGDCWERRTATFMILGRVCTRSCGFCAVETGRPPEYDLLEPGRVAMAVSRLGLRHVVVTSVARDELPDGGAEIFARTIRAIHRRVPGCSVEVLIPDFRGQEDAIRKVVEAGPEIINHNVETVPRLHRRVRPQAKYERSLRVLELAGELGGEVLTKSGLMVGLGESRQELRDVMRDLRSVHLPVEKYYTPQEFEELKQEALELGFRHVESGPLVRSSYHADQQVSSLLQKAV